MMMGLARLFELGLSHDVLTSLAQQLGSDVAFFLDERLIGRNEPDLSPRPALVTGFGERIERVGGVVRGCCAGFSAVRVSNGGCVPSI